LHRTNYPDIEIILVDNGSTNPEVLDYYRSLGGDRRIRILPFNEPFNYARANNMGARAATGSFLLFLNNDTAVFDPDWMQEMTQWAAVDEVGVVGALLLFPAGTIQHAGMIKGLWGIADHVFHSQPCGTSGPFGSPLWYRDYSAVTGACQMLRRDVYEKLGGQDERMKLTASDVELCLRALRSGLRVVYTPFARLSHYERTTRVEADPAADLFYALATAPEFIEDDPYYSPNLSYYSYVPKLRDVYEPDRAADLGERFERYKEGERR
jgi:GT2 family glycosyltransferase